MVPKGTTSEHQTLKMHNHTTGKHRKVRNRATVAWSNVSIGVENTPVKQINHLIAN